ncbi:hypothetical protein [Sediminitomix flava]|uniref:Uncharacterized protein n=1 Tax=Sediminitomix flava TaxID=379075 RepID=A0A315Z9Q3_SEDFL|nr:hypothetical protein [Sediminitomix flava]PWJ40790.1 hypothetical protein BC781_10449 [Sediminitomix flava]
MEKNSIFKESKFEKTYLAGFHVLVIIFLGLLFVLNKEWLRPQFGEESFFTVVLGALPNFLGAIIGGALVVVFAFRLEKLKGHVLMIFSAIMISAFLIYEEKYPQFLASKVTDVYDIYASVLGAITLLIYYFILREFWERSKSKK